MHRKSKIILGKNTIIDLENAIHFVYLGSD